MSETRIVIGKWRAGNEAGLKQNELLWDTWAMSDGCANGLGIFRLSIWPFHLNKYASNGRESVGVPWRLAVLICDCLCNHSIGRIHFSLSKLH